MKSDTSSSNINEELKIDLSTMDSAMDTVKTDQSFNDSMASPETADVVENKSASIVDPDFKTSPESDASDESSSPTSASDNLSNGNNMIVVNKQAVGSDAIRRESITNTDDSLSKL